MALTKSQFPNTPFKPITKKEQKIQSTVGKNVAWFNNDHITRGLAGGKGYEGEPRIWIDNDRGIFYYFLTD